MKTLYKYPGFIFVLSFIALAFCAGCKKFVQIPPPETQLATPTVYSNNASATEAQIYIYNLLWNNNESYNMALNMGLYADELQVPSTNSTEIPYYTNSLITTLTNIYNVVGPWENAYEYIYTANDVIQGLQSNTGCSPSVIHQLTGEALFVRAFWHFYLTNIYGDIPLVITTDYKVNQSLPRAPRVQVLQQVISDLKNAQSMLNANYVDGSDTVTTTERVRPNKAVATALLARTYLFLGDYTKDAAYYDSAAIKASAVINNPEYGLSPLSGTGSVFMKNSSEAIWQLQTPLSGGTQNYDTQDGYNFILTSAPSPYSGQTATISSQLMNSFESGDQREVNWIGTYSTTDSPPVNYYFPYKYKNYTYLGQEYVMVLRLAEQYLIRAEASAHENNLPAAVSDLNMIRNRAGLANIADSIASSNTLLLSAILHERQVELFAEWGHRWFDLERTGNAPLVLGSPGNVCQAKGGVWSSNNYQLLFPIPLNDIANDHNLTQNMGY